MMSLLSQSVTAMCKTFPILFALILLLGGCASTNTSPKGKPQFAPGNLREATIYVIDDLPGISPAGPREVIMVNGRPVGTLDPRQYTWFYVRPGTLDISMNDPQCVNRVMAGTRVNVEEGRSYYFSYRFVRYKRVDTLEPKVMLDPKDSWAEARCETDFIGKAFVLMREADGIAATETHRQVDNIIPIRTYRTDGKAIIEYR